METETQRVNAVTNAILGSWVVDPSNYGDTLKGGVFLDFVTADGITKGWCKTIVNNGFYHAVAYAGKGGSTKSQYCRTIEDAKKWVEEMIYASM